MYPMRPDQSIGCGKTVLVPSARPHQTIQITAQLAHVADWGGSLVFPIPSLQVVEPGSGKVLEP